MLDAIFRAVLAPLLAFAASIAGLGVPGAAPAAARTAAAAPAGSGGGAGVPTATGPVSSTSATKLLGQRIMVGFPGTTASSALLDRIRRGEVGSVILFANNISSRSQVVALTRSLQRAARQGGNPPVLIAVDQEGGEVKRFAGGPPHLSPPQMAATGKPSTARAQGRETGSYLAGLGVNMELAPVADVPTSGSSFIWQQGRAFAFSANTVATYATQFTLGIQSAHVAATAKHFPGLGSARVDSDNQLDVLHPTAAQRAANLTPYRTLIARGIDAIMVTTGAFPAYDSREIPAALSSKVIGGLLRRRLHFQGVAITDALEAPTGHDPITAGVLAARAGADILLYTDSADAALPALKRDLAAGRISMANARDSYNRVLALKRGLR